MRQLDLEATSGPEFPEYAHIAAVAPEDGEFMIGMEFVSRKGLQRMLHIGEGANTLEACLLRSGVVVAVHPYSDGVSAAVGGNTFRCHCRQLMCSGFFRTLPVETTRVLDAVKPPSHVGCSSAEPNDAFTVASSQVSPKLSN
ncbi:hypothetical protein PIB30_028950 [Stylosanthes scabra]|uniref:Uncharacterized protein n=1 Tax=Stylosanthes scabra TaxID=79078 RepID=A0ABU6TBE0_9FABA|nr:hypothetical protein [Stylosanthes scabra]